MGFWNDVSRQVNNINTLDDAIGCASKIFKEIDKHSNKVNSLDDLIKNTSQLLKKVDNNSIDNNNFFEKKSKSIFSKGFESSYLINKRLSKEDIVGNFGIARNEIKNFNLEFETNNNNIIDKFNKSEVVKLTKILKEEKIKREM